MSKNCKLVRDPTGGTVPVYTTDTSRSRLISDKTFDTMQQRPNQLRPQSSSQPQSHRAIEPARAKAATAKIALATAEAAAAETTTTATAEAATAVAITATAETDTAGGEHQN